MNGPYKKTEQVLCAYESLKLKLTIDTKDIMDMQVEGQRYNTNHKTANPEEWDAEIDDEIRHRQKIRYRERGMLRTKKLVERINDALSLLDKEDYELIRDIYFRGQPIAVVASNHNCCVKTIGRNRKRVVIALMVLFYGADALE